MAHIKTFSTEKQEQLLLSALQKKDFKAVYFLNKIAQIDMPEIKLFDEDFYPIKVEEGSLMSSDRLEDFKRFCDLEYKTDHLEKANGLIEEMLHAAPTLVLNEKQFSSFKEYGETLLTSFGFEVNFSEQNTEQPYFHFWKLMKNFDEEAYKNIPSIPSEEQERKLFYEHVKAFYQHIFNWMQQKDEKEDKIAILESLNEIAKMCGEAWRSEGIVLYIQLANPTKGCDTKIQDNFRIKTEITLAQLRFALFNQAIDQIKNSSDVHDRNDFIRLYGKIFALLGAKAYVTKDNLSNVTSNDQEAFLQVFFDKIIPEKYNPVTIAWALRDLMQKDRELTSELAKDLHGENYTEKLSLNGLLKSEDLQKIMEKIEILEQVNQ